MKLSLKKGFTLVELLVVMAIISLLAAIVVPNVINYIRQGRATRARADISGLESALVKILSDSGRGNLGQLFNPKAVAYAIGVDPGTTLTAASFDAARDLYTQALYIVLREGRSALGQTVTAKNTQIVMNLGADNGVNNQGETVPSLMNLGVVAKLSSSYVELGFDPWGNLYNIYPGPWPQGNGAIPFRKLLPEVSSTDTVKLPGSGDRGDVLTLTLIDTDAGDVALTVGYPAPRDKVAFVWSNGENLVSGIAIYSPTGYDENLPDDVKLNTYYDVVNNTDPFLAVGGDDVNNWDNGSSWTRFY